MESRDQLDKYVNRGNCLRCQVEYISTNIRNEMRRSTYDPRLFYFVVASSGMGKSQLAASLSLPVVYIPLSNTQSMYGCFNFVSQAVLEALQADSDEQPGRITDTFKSANELRSVHEKFKTVGLLVSLFKAVYGRTNEESLKLLSGYYGERTIKYRPMFISDAKITLDKCMSTENHSQNMTPIFFIDEVPACMSKDDAVYRQCLFLRNIIRNLNCISVLSGAEAAVMNAFENIREASRRDRVDIEYLRLILKLPSTSLDAFRCNPNYARLLQSVSPDIYSMLSSTRPLCAQYVMDAMLSEQGISCNMYQLTAAVLSKAKEQIVESMINFTSPGGLYGQMAMLHPKFISNTIDDIPEPKKDIEYFLDRRKERCIRFKLTAAVLSKAKEQIVENKFNFTSPGGLYGQMAILHPKFISNTDISKPYQDIEDFLDAQKQSCMRHHFGKMNVTNADESILSLYLASDHTYVKKGDGMDTKREPFLPNIDFGSPTKDFLLYMICIRDGLYASDEEKKFRISSTFALLLLLEHRGCINMPLFRNTNQISRFGRFMEMETLSAAIIASHTYPNSLGGCPLQFFLRGIIAELSPFKDYTSFDCIKKVPRSYENVKVGLLSPANCNWRENTEDLFVLQNRSIVLGACHWSCNRDRNDGTISLCTDLTAASIGALETKCYGDNIPTEELIKAIENAVLNANDLTIMIVTKSGTIRSSNVKFRDATFGVTVAIVEGNACKDRWVATKLKWKRLNSVEINPMVMSKHTVIIIDLESIYYDRYARLEIAYREI